MTDFSHNMRNAHQNHAEIPFLTYGISKKLKIKKKTTVVNEAYRSRHFHTLPWGLQNGTTPMEKNLTISTNTVDTFAF